jgi:hypothetical protein
MDSILALFVLLLLLGGAVLICVGIITFVRAVLSPLQSGANPTSRDEIDGMNEGDYHNGPGGYQAMSSYPDSYYGGDHDEEHE